MTLAAIGQHRLTFDNGGGSLTARVKNWVGYEQGGIWRETDEVQEAAADPGDLQGGPFSYGEAQTRAPLQLFLKDDADAENATRVHGRLSADPSAWFEIAANKGGPGFNKGVAPVVTRNERRTRFNKLWSTGAATPRQAALNWFLRKHQLVKVTRSNGPNAPRAFQFRLRLPPGYTFEILPSGAAVIRNGGGVSVFRMRAPYAWDSADGGDVRGPGDNSALFAASYTIDQVLENNGHPVYLFTMSIDGDLGLAVWPVFGDPTTTIDSDAAILDTECRTAKPTNNYSSITRAAAYEITGGGTKISAHTQFASGIPDPALYQYDAFRWYWVGANFTGQVANHATMYAVAPGNAPTIASCTWNTKDGSTAWAGGTSGGIGASDIVAATATVISGGGSDQPVNNTSLSTTILDSIAAAGGSSTIVKAPNLQNSTVYGHRTREHADEQYFEIDYSDLPAGGSRGSIDRHIHRSIDRAVR